MSTFKAQLINDRILRPWIVNEDDDELLRNDCNELDIAARRTAPYKKAGDFGLSSLDVQPREMIEIEKLLLNLDSYPIIKNKHHSDRGEVSRPSSAQIHQNGRSSTANRVPTELPARTSSAINRRYTQPEFVHESQQAQDHEIKYVIEMPQHKSRHVVKRFITAASLKQPKKSVYGNYRRKAAVPKEETVLHREKRAKAKMPVPGVDMSTEKFQRFLRKQAEIYAYHQKHSPEEVEDDYEYRGDERRGSKHGKPQSARINSNSSSSGNTNNALGSVALEGTGFAAKLRQSTTAPRARPASAPAATNRVASKYDHNDRGPLLHLTEELDDMDSDGDREQFIRNDNDADSLSSNKKYKKSVKNSDYTDDNRHPSMPTATHSSRVSPRQQKLNKEATKMNREGDFILGYGGPQDYPVNPQGDQPNDIENVLNFLSKNRKQGWVDERKGKIEGEEKEEKRLFWDANETPLIDRVITPTQEKINAGFDPDSLKKGYPALSRRRIKELKDLREHMMTAAGVQISHAHPEANKSLSRREETVASAALTRKMVEEVTEKVKLDSTWDILTTPGYMALLGPEKIYKSEYNLAHTTNEKYDKALREVDLSQGIKMDKLRQWTENAAYNKVKIFTPGGGFKFN